MTSREVRAEPNGPRGRLRILAILNGSVAGGFSGGDFHTASVLNEWAGEHEVELYLPRDSSPEIIDLLSPAVKVRRRSAVHQPPSRVRYLLWVTTRMLTASWYVLNRRGRWDVMIATSHFVFDVLPLLLAGDSLARGVYWWHHATAPQGRPAWTASLVRASEAVVVRALAKRDVSVLTGNSRTKEWLVAKGITPHAITLTPNGPSFKDGWVPDNEAFRMEPFLKRLFGRRFVLFFARLTNLKGAGDLPAICRHVLEAAGDTPIVICGTEGSDAEAVHRELDAFEKNGSVKFMGFITGATKSWLFQRAHVVITPSYEEGWGITVGDGVAAGCWVVAYDLPAVREAFPDGPILVPLGDTATFAKATTLCLDKPRPSQPSISSSGSWKRIAWEDLEAIVGQKSSS